MGKIIDFLKGRKSVTPAPMRDVRELVAPLSIPAVQLVASDLPGRSFLGGSPMSGSEIEWPCRSRKPLTFLASIHLPSLREAYEFEWLPATGCLLFFFDAEEQPWGFDPKDGDGWAVIHVPEGSGVVIPSERQQEVRHQYVEFRRIDTLPSWERPDVQTLNLSYSEADALCEIAAAVYGDAAAHQVGGYPDPVQGDGMELECQLVSNGIYCGDAAGYQSPEAKRLEDGAKDWKLLLQMASDDDLDVMWGDVGNLYFWIREQDARDGHFERVWTVLQCS